MLALRNDGLMPEEHPASGDGGKALYTPEQKRAAELLRAMRRRARMSQGKVAEALKRPVGYIHRMESGQRRIDLVEWCWFLRAVGADPVEFLEQLAPSFTPPLQLGQPASTRRPSQGQET